MAPQFAEPQPQGLGVDPAKPQLTAQRPAGLGATAAVALGVCLPLVVGGGIFALVYAITKTEVSGQLTLNAEGESGKVVFVPTECSSGQRFGFLGVDLRNATAGQGLRIVSDPIQGPVLILQRSPGDARQIPLGKCKTAQVEAHPTNTTINEVRVVEGHATLDCEHVQADLKFSGCH